MKKWKHILAVFFCLGILSSQALYASDEFQYTTVEIEYPKIEFNKFIIGEEAFASRKITPDERKVITDTYFDGDEQKHDRLVNFGDLEYCRNYIRFEDNYSQFGWSITPTTEYVSRNTLKHYCSRGHWGKSGALDCPPKMLECRMTCPTFQCALYKGQLDNVIAFIQGGADVNQKLYGYRKTKKEQYSYPIYAAVTYRNIDLLKILLEAGALPNQIDTSGISPLFRTVTPALDPPPELIEHLLKAGANLDVVINNKKTSFEEWVQSNGNPNTNQDVYYEILAIVKKHRALSTSGE